MISIGFGVADDEAVLNHALVYTVSHFRIALFKAVQVFLDVSYAALVQLVSHRRCTSLHANTPSAQVTL